MSTSTRSGKNAETRWEVQDLLPESSLVSIDLLTGRTHQIRVHFASIHHAVVGDPIYGPRNPSHSTLVQQILKPINRQMLHARQIRFTHPTSGEEMCFRAPLPYDMVQLIKALRSSNLVG